MTKSPAASCRMQCRDTRPYLEIPNNQGTRLTRLVQCNRCGLVLESPRPPQAEIEAFYQSPKLWTDSKDAEGRSWNYIDKLEEKKPLFLELIERLEVRKKGGTLLDIGCGAGLLESLLDKSRWKVTGVEMAPFIGEFGRTKLQTHVRTGRFETMDFGNERFDVIALKYVVDHMEDPYGGLQKVRTLIKPDGLLLIADLINVDSTSSRFFGPGFRLYHPMHLTYFSPKTITSYLDELGFRVTAIEFPFFRTPYYSPTAVLLWGKRFFTRLLQRLTGFPKERVFSTAFYGSMMDVWAEPKAADR